MSHISCWGLCVGAKSAKLVPEAGTLRLRLSQPCTTSQSRISLLRKISRGGGVVQRPLEPSRKDALPMKKNIARATVATGLTAGLLLTGVSGAFAAVDGKDLLSIESDANKIRVWGPSRAET